MDVSRTGFSIGEIASSIGAKALGNTDLTITGVASPKLASENDLALAFNDRFRPDLILGRAQAAVLGNEDDWESLNLKAVIIINNPRLGLSQITKHFRRSYSYSEDMRTHSLISDRAVIGEGSSIGPFSYIGPGVQLGEGCIVGSHVSIDEGSIIGNNGAILSGTRIGPNTMIGKNFICHQNTVIGCDGYSYDTAMAGAVEQVKETLGLNVNQTQSKYAKVYSLGHVRIGDDVEIGACTAIDRGTIDLTIIGDRTKIDNLVHIAHNVRVGDDCLLCGQVGIAGSSQIGDRVVFAGQTGVKDHIKVGNDVIAGGATKIYSNVSNGRIVMGSPAVEMQKNIATYKAMRKLPKLVEKVSELERKLTDLTK
ncbi:MAG: UDP-3-O-(3-hydroxymyristoyl)glucosamine N-acyltransferase [Rhodobacteraceae bacterium]|nr:UDP-3-O-(3-hydroxymyristoyl)glucosamine N-acyltransferase [Paracoccaceae bacterium]